MSETKLSKTGIVLAIIQAMRVIPKVHPSHVAQCVGVLEVRCRDLRRVWMKMNLAGI